jgi:excisionase family DNA binding protein
VIMGDTSGWGARTMASDTDSELLTISEAAKLLRISTITLHRWLKQGRLPAYRIGPKAMRIRRADLERVLVPVQRSEPETVSAPPSEAPPERFGPVTSAQRLKRRAALAASERLLQQMRERRGGEFYEESWPMIREARDERSRQL